MGIFVIFMINIIYFKYNIFLIIQYLFKVYNLNITCFCNYFYVNNTTKITLYHSLLTFIHINLLDDLNFNLNTSLFRRYGNPLV